LTQSPKCVILDKDGQFLSLLLPNPNKGAMQERQHNNANKHNKASWRATRTNGQTTSLVQSPFFCCSFGSYVKFLKTTLLLIM